MKTILTLFVLLFSSSVFAGDDLSGKKILCLKMSVIQPSQDMIKVDAFHFKDKKNVDNIFNTPFEIHTFKYFYDAQFRNIYLYLPKENKDKKFFYKINRKTLSVTIIAKNSNEIYYNESSCSIVKGDLYLLIDNKIENFKEKLKLENQL